MTDKSINHDTHSLYEALLAIAREGQRADCERFFKTAPGQYGEGDRFIGVRVPDCRRLCRSIHPAPQPFISELLHSPWHEMRFCGLVLLCTLFQKSKSEAERKEIYELYKDHTHCINNWDLVDASAPIIPGSYMYDNASERPRLLQWARHGHLWEQRIAIVSTLGFIRRGRVNETFSLSTILLHHPHDLIHKAVGWMLREAGKRDRDRLTHYLMQHKDHMPRTMLRYAIEKYPPEERSVFMTKGA